MEGQPILVVHSDQAVAEMLAELLRSSGYDALIAGPDSWEMLARSTPSLVLADLNLAGPRPDWTLIERIRRTLPDPGVGMIALATSALVSDSACPAPLPDLTCPLVLLPCDLDEVLATVRAALGPDSSARRPRIQASG